MSHTVTAIFETRQDMEATLKKLEMLGVTQSQIGVIMNDDMRAKSFAIDTHNKEDTGMATGATIGGIVTGIAAAIVGVGTLTIPGLNLIVAGSIVSGFAGAGIGAAIGGFVGGLVGIGIPEHEAKLYEGQVKAGHIMLAVEAADHKQETAIRDLLNGSDALDIAS